MPADSKIYKLLHKSYCCNKKMQAVGNDLNILRFAVWYMTKHYRETGDFVGKRVESPGLDVQHWPKKYFGANGY